MKATPSGWPQQRVGIATMPVRRSTGCAIHHSQLTLGEALLMVGGASSTRAKRTDDDGPEHWADGRRALLDPEGHRWWFPQRMRG